MSWLAPPSEHFEQSAIVLLADSNHPSLVRIIRTTRHVDPAPAFGRLDGRGALEGRRRWDEGHQSRRRRMTLTRADTRAHVELYEDGAVLVWPAEDA